MQIFINMVLNENIQKIKFEDFSEPILIPQFNMYLVKLLKSSKEDKDPSAEKIIFTDKNGKDFVFNADDVQKSGKSDFYINLNTLRRYYDIKFETEEDRYIPNLTDKEINSLYTKSYNNITNNKRDYNKFIDTVKKALFEIYNEYVGIYNSTLCDVEIEGILNIYPKKGAIDDNNNQWSLINQIPHNELTLKLLLNQYIGKYKTFELSDFLNWVEDNKNDALNNDYINRMVREEELKDKTNRISSKYLNKIFNTNDIFFTTCPNDSKNKNLLILYIDQQKIKVQIVQSKGKKIFYDGEYYYVLIHPSSTLDNINYKSNFILFTNGTMFPSNQIKREMVNFTKKPLPAFRFIDPPIIGNELIENI